MGRKKLEIKARETREGRQVTFSKRRMGVEKKAQELATLCDIPLLLLLFSPGHRLSWISGSHGTPEEVLKSFADIPFQERSKRKLKSLEQLNHAFKKSDHEINVDEFSQLTNATQSVKDLITYFHDIRTNLLQKLRECETPKTFEEACQMQEILQIRLNQIEMHKSLSMSRHFAVPYDETIRQESSPQGGPFTVSYDETIGQQVAQSFGSIDATRQEAWESKCMPTIYENELATIFNDPEMTPNYLASACGCHPNNIDTNQSTIFENGSNIANAMNNPIPQPFSDYEDVKPFNIQALNGHESTKPS